GGVLHRQPYRRRQLPASTIHKRSGAGRKPPGPARPGVPSRDAWGGSGPPRAPPATGTSPWLPAGCLPPSPRPGRRTRGPGKDPAHVAVHLPDPAAGALPALHLALPGAAALARRGVAPRGAPARAAAAPPGAAGAGGVRAQGDTGRP